MGCYCVTFVGDYFNLTTMALGCSNEEEAIELAKLTIANEYGWNLEEVSKEITAVLEGTY
jgi:hypothetical protein